MSKAPRLPQKEQEQAKEPSPPRIKSPTPRSLPFYSTEFDGPQAGQFNTRRHDTEHKPIPTPLNRPKRKSFKRFKLSSIKFN